MKKIFNFIKSNILLSNFIFIGINILISFILYLVNIRYRSWIYLLLLIIYTIGFIIGIIQIIIKLSQNKRKYLIPLSFISFIIIISLTAVYQIFFITNKVEHTTSLDGKKYVAKVQILSNIDVYYYDYYNPFLMGTQVRILGYFGKGEYDPFIKSELVDKIKYTYYDNEDKIINYKDVIFYKDEGGNIKDTKVIETNPYPEVSDFNPNDDYILPETAPVLYEKKFGNKVLRFSKVDNVLGQNQIVIVLRSNDGGTNFYYENSQTIQVSNEAKFVFLTEKQGFAVSTGSVNLKDNRGGIFVTNDSGQSFKRSIFNYQNEEVEWMTIEDIPYYENKVLKLKCSIYVLKENKKGYENKDLIFTSNDDGLTWSLLQKK